MCLYSENKLCALVLLVDSCLNVDSYCSPLQQQQLKDSKDSTGELGQNKSRDRIAKRFYQICNRNGYDFHFQSVEHQIEATIRSLNRAADSCRTGDDGEPSSSRVKISIGDFYTTKHSNLSKTHVVYHLAAYDSENNVSQSLNQSLKKSELSSRHPVILGLRNVLKSCFSNNIQILTFPLLLTHQMTEVRANICYFE